MGIRNFAATTAKSNDVLASTGTASTLMGAVDTAITAAAGNVTISGDVTAAGLVDAIQTAADALRAQLEGQVLNSSYPVTLVVSGTPTQNQIRQAVENILGNLAQSAEYARG